MADVNLNIPMTDEEEQRKRALLAAVMPKPAVAPNQGAVPVNMMSPVGPAPTIQQKAAEVQQNKTAPTAAEETPALNIAGVLGPKSPALNITDILGPTASPVKATPQNSPEDYIHGVPRKGTPEFESLTPEQQSKAVFEARPGWLKALDIAGTIAAPRAMAAIPGTRINMAMQNAAARQQQMEDLQAQEEKAKVGTEQARQQQIEATTKTISEDPKRAAYTDLMTGDAGKPRTNPDTGMPYTAEEALTQVQKAGMAAKAPTAEQDKQRFDAISAQMKTDPTKVSAADRQWAMGQHAEKQDKLPSEIETAVTAAVGARPNPFDAKYSKGENDPQYRADLKTYADAINTAKANLPENVQKKAENVQKQLDRESNERSKESDKLETRRGQVNQKIQDEAKKLSDASDKLDEAQKQLSSGAEGAALGTISALRTLTGLNRINTVELNELAHARGLIGAGESLFTRNWSGVKLTGDQIKELNGLLDYARSKVTERQSQLTSYQDAVTGANDLKSINNAQAQYTKGLNTAGKKPASEEQLPKEAANSLKEGKHTTFGNGQVWTLQNGKPVRIS